MTEGLNLTVPGPEKKSGSQTLIITLLVIILGLGVARLALLIADRSGNAAPGGELGAGALKELALKLESQGFGENAAGVWREYLALADIPAKERAGIWYRIGKLHQESHAYEKALEAYYRSESHARLEDLETELGRRIQESLEASARFAALRYELKDRVGLDESAGDEVLAEIGSFRLTTSELDRRIEEQIERQLAPLAAVMPEDQLKGRKEALLKRFSTAEERAGFLEQVVWSEILYRKAREEKLMDEPLVRSLVQDAERTILAQQALDREMSGKINITPGDLQTFYEANKGRYVEKPEGEDEGRQRTFAEARPDVYRDLHAQKSVEVQGALFDRLKEKYDVIVHASKLGPAGAGSE